MRNVPLLLQIFIWYRLVLKPLPRCARRHQDLGHRRAFQQGPDAAGADLRAGCMDGAAAGLLVAVIASLVIRRWAAARQEATGADLSLRPARGTRLIVALPVLFFALAGWPVTLRLSGDGHLQLSAAA